MPVEQVGIFINRQNCKFRASMCASGVVTDTGRVTARENRKERGKSTETWGNFYSSIREKSEETRP